MKWIKWTLFLLLTLAVSLGVAWAAIDRQQSVAEIDTNIASIQADLEQANAEAKQYEGGVLLVLLNLRIATDKQTIAMLQQKRASIFHRINLQYIVDGKPFPPASPETTTQIKEQISDTERQISEAERDSAKYSGGLVKMMAEMKRATAQQALALLRLQLVSAEYGLPILQPQPPPEQEPAPGTIEPDEDVL